MSLAELDHIAQSVLTTLWRSSWQAGALAGMVPILQMLLRGKLSARWRYNMWAIVVIRLMIPITPSSPLSVFNLSMPFSATARSSNVDSQEISLIPVAPALTTRAGSASPVRVSGTNADAIPHVARLPWSLVVASIWLTGILAMLGRIVLSSIRLSRIVRRMESIDHPQIIALLDECRARLGIRRRVELRASSDLGAPALMGVFHPTLLLPGDLLGAFSLAELRLILLHELGHLKRRDVMINWLLAVLQSVHWFNPAIWLAFARMRADRELACDELVLSNAPAGENTDYGHTLVKLLQMLSQPGLRDPRGLVPGVGTVGLLERAHPMRRRITMIAQYAKRRSALRTWTAVACLIVLAGVGLTDGVEGDAPPAKVNGPSDSDAPAHRSSTKSATRAIDNMTFSGHKVKVVPLPDGGTEIHADRVIFEPSTRRSNSSDGKGTIAIETYNPATNSIVLTPAPTTQRISDAEKTYAQFRKRLPEVKFDAIPFSDAVDFLRNITGLNIVVNTRALEASGIDMNMPISLRLKDVTLEQALRQLLQQAGGGTVSLGFGVQGNAVVISTSDSVPTRVRAYDVSDLLDGATTRPADRSEAANLVQLIEKNVAPDSWRDDGGTIGTISRFGQMLIISTTDMNHLEIDRLLAELRSAMPSHPGEAG